MTKTPEQQIAELKNQLAMAKQKKTLRDEYAMAALTGLLANPDLAFHFSVIPHDNFFEEMAWAYANLMMEERNQ